MRVLFFGQLKEIVGRAVDDAEVSDGACVEELFARYGARYPQLAGFRGSVVASVNREFTDWKATLAGGDEVAFLPPVSGGAGAAGMTRGADICELVRRTIQATELVARLKAPEDGAVVVFEGITRNHSKGRRTLYLDYEAYEPMALAKLIEIAREMRTQFPVDRVALVHRLGRIKIGETSVFIGVSSAHRRAAFDACRFGIDTLKRTVPIWKKEYFEDGEAWVEGEVPPLPSISRPPESKV